MIAFGDIKALGDAEILARVTTPVLLCDAVEDTPVKFDTMAAGAAPLATFSLPKKIAVKKAMLCPVRKGDGNPFAGNIFVGRAKTSDISLRHESVSKAHAFFQHANDAWTLTDNESSNKTLVNGVLLPPNQPRVVRSKDSLVFGSVVTYFLLPADLVAFCHTVIDVS